MKVDKEKEQKEAEMYYGLSLKSYTARCRAIRNQYTLAKVLLHKDATATEMHLCYHRLLDEVGIDLGFKRVSNTVTIKSLPEFEPFDLRGRSNDNVRGKEAVQRKISNANEVVEWLQAEPKDKTEVNKTVAWLKKGG